MRQASHRFACPICCRSSRCRTSCSFPNVFLPLHIFEPRYREMVADALDERPDDRHGAAAAGLGARLRGTAAGLSDRLQRRDHPRRAAGRRPLQHRAARRRTVPHRRGGPDAQLPARASSSRCSRRRCGATTAPPSGASARSSRRCSRRRVERAGTPSDRGCRRRWPTKTWSTRWRSTSTSSRSRSRRCSSSTCLRARAESLVELLEMKIMMARTPGRLERRALTARLTPSPDEASADGGSRLTSAAITSTIFSPWKRPFSMKIVPVSTPAIAPPATNSPGTLVSNVSGSWTGASRSFSVDAGAAHQIARRRDSRSAGTRRRPESPPACARRCRTADRRRPTRTARRRPDLAITTTRGFRTR